MTERKYPYYAVWLDHRTGMFEVARWDSPAVAEVVQTNIGTRAKASAACKIWQQREDDNVKGTD